MWKWGSFVTLPEDQTHVPVILKQHSCQLDTQTQHNALLCSKSPLREKSIIAFNHAMLVKASEFDLKPATFSQRVVSAHSECYSQGTARDSHDPRCSTGPTPPCERGKDDSPLFCCSLPMITKNGKKLLWASRVLRKKILVWRRKTSLALKQSLLVGRQQIPNKYTFPIN